MNDMKVYFDNAATTSVDPLVFEAMTPWLTGHWGNPSSTHSFGREAKGAIEMARKTISELLNTTPGEIYFISGGTEGDNTVLRGVSESKEIQSGITSPVEHHAVLHTMEHLHDAGKLDLSILPVDSNGQPSLAELDKILTEKGPSLVSLMYANNEIGNLLDMEKVGEIIAAHNGYFHSDTVQAMGHFPIDVKKLKVNAMIATGHKFHGPKGAGFMYLRKDKRFHPLLTGGSQERNVRGGTENVAGIVGLAKAFELAHERMDADRKHIQSIKNHMISGLKAINPNITFNGDSANEHSLYTVLNARFPASSENEFLLFNLDMKGIAVSGGSACNSGSDKGSHVLEALGMPDDCTGVRFSFSRHNTIEEADYVLTEIKNIFP